MTGHQLAAKAGLLFAALTVGALSAEATVRIADVQVAVHVLQLDNFRLSDDPLLRYELQPLSADGATRINSVGMRDREYPLHRSAGSYRILVVGDSVAYGLTVEQRQAFPQVLERMLNEHASGPNSFEVLNLGVSGYNIEQVIERLRTQGLAYAPDLVIYAYSLNDPQTFSFEMQALELQQRAANRQPPPGRVVLRWFAHSRVFLLAWRALQRPWTQSMTHARELPDFLSIKSGRQVEYFEGLHSGEAWMRVEKGLDALSQLERSSGARMRILVAVLPMDLGQTVPYPLAALHDRIVAAAQRRSLATLDLATTLTDTAGKTVRADFNDPFHLSAEGNRRVAARLSRWLDEAGAPSNP